jgi:hypothetical protein
VCSSARYVVSGSGIEFYLAPDTYPMSRFYQERNGHFATASLSGPTMSVKYDDFVDFDDEVYRLDGATSNAFAQVDAGGR